MKKRTPRSRKKASKPKRKTIMRHSREGVRSKARRGTRAKSKPGRKGTAAKAAKSTKAAPKRKSKAKSAARGAARRAAPRSLASKKTAPSRSGSRRRSVDMGSTRGIGADSAGQSGDTEGLSRVAEADSESVEELVEEGQTFEAGIISGVEEAGRSGRRGVRTRQVPEDDVPQEYLDEQ